MSGVSGFIMDELVYPIYDMIYQIVYEAIDSVMNGELKRSAPDLDPNLSRYGKGSRLFLSYLIITFGSVIAAGVAIRVFMIFDTIRR